MQTDCDVTVDFISAIRQGRLERVEALINSFGLCYSQKWEGGYVFLCKALECGQIHVANLLLHNNCQVNSKDKNLSYTPLHLAVVWAYVRITDMRGGDDDVELSIQITLVHVAIQWTAIEMIKLLLSKDADINAKDTYGKTPIFYAVMFNFIEIVTVLLQHGADVMTVDKCGTTPLHCTALSELVTSKSNRNVNAKIAELLLCKGANVNAEIGDGTTLHIACQNGNEQLVATLLKNRADVKCIDKNSRTPLHLASEIGNLNIVMLLLKFGAIIDSKDQHGKTAVDIAFDKQHLRIVTALRKNPNFSELLLLIVIVYVLTSFVRMIFNTYYY